MSEASEMYEFFEYKKEDTIAIQRFYAPYFKDCRKVLDIGCGRGEFLELLKGQGVAAVGVDLDAASVEAVTASGGEAVCADVFEFLRQVKAAEFDGLFMSHLLEHLSFESIAELFELCHAALVPGGKVIATVPSVASIGMHLDWFYKDPTHVGFRHPDTIRLFMSKAGFEVLEAGPNPNAAVPYLGSERSRLLELIERLKGTRTAIKDRIAAGPADTTHLVKTVEGPRGRVRKRIGAWLLDIISPQVDALIAASRSDLESAHDINAHLIEEAEIAADLLVRLDPSFESYVYATKGKA